MPAETMKLRKRDRQQKILDEFRLSPSVRLGDLAEHYGVTKETIRRDIDELSAQGLLARTYGGASLLNREPGISERTRVNPDGRRRMAALAADLVADSAVIMIDTGSTMIHVCERLAITVPKTGGIALTAITNSLSNTTILGANPAIRVILCPGTYDEHENAAFGPQTVEFIARFNVDAVLMSAGGIDGDIVSDANSEAVAVKRAMLRQTSRTILLMEKRKFNHPQFEAVCALSEISDLVTDEPVIGGAPGTTAIHVAAPQAR